ncbi:bidirectional sugar transporter SWEET2-like [Hibiscus syriacus]|uniref:bidirectional sugar transporter SWEET2-like n=1 Tax=Hibiscus syriacus TaxID=106335 RepID=UPI00192252B4|nr:bidirectional sugar transporter SWEET2-like [Hibiscus syriacus]
MTINSIDAVFQMTHIIIFIVHADREKKDDWVATGIFWLSRNHSCWKLADSRSRNAMDLCWVIKLCFSRINVCFPVVYNLIRTKSVEFMPFYLSLSIFLLSTSFFLYDIFNFDAFIYVPNGIGIVLGILQLVL